MAGHPASVRVPSEPAQVDPGTGTDPIYTFTSSTNADQLSVARYVPGEGSHGGRWAVYHATWVNSEDADTLITAFATLESYASQRSADDRSRRGGGFPLPDPAEQLT
jgi:hypothetical protein